MPKSAFVLLLAAAAFVAAPLTVPAAAAAPAAQAASTPVPITVAHWRDRSHRRPTDRGQRKIACTSSGCHPIPPGCYPRPGYDWWGNPSGYDVIVCPGR